MNYREIPGYERVRQELVEARTLEYRAASENQKIEARKKIREIRHQLSKLIYEYTEERKIK